MTEPVGRRGDAFQSLRLRLQASDPFGFADFQRQEVRQRAWEETLSAPRW